MTMNFGAALAAAFLCVASGAALAQTPAPPAKPVPTAAPMTPPTTPPGPSKAAAAPTPKSSGPAVFPTAVSDKYSKETAGKGRMHTCLDQYHANKATGGNGGLKWIQKGGGYYSACLKKLKA